MRTEMIRSEALANERPVWLQPPPGNARPTALCLLLDGEYYTERMDAPTLLEREQVEGDLPPLAIAYVSHLDAKTRWPESFCDPNFATFVSEELLPWVRARFEFDRSDGPALLGGLSLTGLSATHAGMSSAMSSAAPTEGRFAGVLAQSASYWWEENRIVEWARGRSFGSLVFRIVCGARETDENVEHGDGLIQRISQLDSNRAMRDVLRSTGHRVSYAEFDGGHELEPWRDDLPRSIGVLLESIGRSP